MQVECVSSPSVPQAHLHWAVIQDTQRVEFVPVEEVEITDDGNWITKSVLGFVAGDVEEVVVECHAEHDVLGDDTKMHSKSIRIGKLSHRYFTQGECYIKH